MLVDDNLREVLMNSDITTIKQMVNVNKTMALFCNDKIFWNNKFKRDGLPIINNKLNTFEEWVKEYEIIYKCKKDSINKLLVNKFKSQETFDGSIRFNIIYGNLKEYSDDSDDCDVDVFNDSIPYYIIEKNDINQIQIEFVSEDACGTYKIWYYINKCGYYIEDSLYDEILNILIKIIYYSFKDNNIKITDNIWYHRW